MNFNCTNRLFFYIRLRFVILSGLEKGKQKFSMYAFKILFSQKICNCGRIFEANLKCYLIIFFNSF